MVLKRHLAAIHSVEKTKGPLLCLANAPFFSESEYVTRDAKIFQQMKKKLEAKDEEIHKMKQKTEVLEDVVSKQAEELKKLSEQMKYLMEAVSKQAQP